MAATGYLHCLAMALKAIQKKNFVAVTKRALLSTFCLTVALLISIDLAVKALQIHDNSLVNDSPRVKLFRQFFASDYKTDVVLLGSSLALALYHCDKEHCISKANTTQAVPADPVEYIHALYMTQLFKQVTPSQLNIVNLGWTAALVTDAKLILSNVFASRKTPKLVIYLVSRRDFIDRLVPANGAIGGQAVFGLTKAESNRLQLSQIVVNATRLATKVCDLVIPIDLTRQLHKLGPHPSFPAVADTTIACFWSFYQKRSELKQWLVEAICKHFRREANLWAATTHASVNAKKLTLFEHDLLNYNDRYNPPDFLRLTCEFSQLEGLISLCHQHNSFLIVVNMPITQENRALVSKRLDKTFLARLRSTTTKYNVPFIDLDDNTIFSRGDFRDSVHLNADGGMKFQQLLLDRLRANKIPLAKLLSR